MSWNTVIGQQRAKEILRQALKNQRLAHAYLFSGPRGTGKDAMAIELAKVLNCERDNQDACGECSGCLKFGQLAHPNVKLVFALPVGKNEKYGDSPVAKLSDEDIGFLREEIQQKARQPYHRITLPKANNIKINSIREIRKESSLTAFEGGKKVFIIIEAENLSDESANALLKTLEEPQEDTLLILTTSQPDNLLPTIISRCQHIRFGPLTVEEISSALQQRETIEPARAEFIAQLSHGSYSRALELTSTTLEERYAEAVEFLRTALYKPRQELYRLTDEIIAENERGDMEEFLGLLQSWFHAAMVLRENDVLQSPFDDGESLRKFIEHHPSVDYSALFTATERSISLLNKNVYIPLILLNLAVDLRKIILPLSSRQPAVTDKSELL